MEVYVVDGSKVSGQLVQDLSAGHLPHVHVSNQSNITAILTGKNLANSLFTSIYLPKYSLGGIGEKERGKRMNGKVQGGGGIERKIWRKYTAFSYFPKTNIKINKLSWRGGEGDD